MKLRLSLALAAVAVVAATTVAASAGTSAARVYEFRGELLSASSSSVQLRVEGGTHNALKALIGQSQDQAFAVGSTTEVLVYAHGRPHRGTVADLRQGDEIVVRVRAPHGASLASIETTPAATIADHTTPAKHSAGPLYLYVGTVTGPQPDGHVSLHVTSGNWRALHTMLGQPLDQTFATDDGTIYLLWQGKVPTVIDPSQLKAGDRITVRVHTSKSATLAQVESTPAAHVGDHEPGNPESES
ncbi:MAG TPA: hypothetical protein VHC45_16345 [Gaiellaceae bacterium]|nr:hypothetical protein [Gaiellaceae bacterium]